MAHRPDETQDDAQWRTAGDRIQTLLDASAAGGTVARERAEQLVGEVTDLYGAGLERMLRIATAADPELADRLAADDLVASLLLVHGLHPHDVERRVSDALDTVRPYLGSHGGDVSLIEVAGDPDNLVVRLQFSGSCKSCPSSAVTLELAVEDAVRAAAPEIESIEVVAAEPQSSSGTIPAESLLSRVHAQGHGNRLASGSRPRRAGTGRGRRIPGRGHARCWRAGSATTCSPTTTGAAACGDSLAGAALHRAMAAEAVLRCPRCHAHFDVVHAGACIDGNGEAAAHLEPIPLLERDGVLSVAVVADEVSP